MSTLTSSASPAASPRSSGYTQYRPSSRPAKSPASISKPPTPPTFSSTSSRTFAHPAVAQSPRQQPKPQYIDAGTQYSPEGYPPTATSTVTPSSSRNKRKQTSPSPPMSPAEDVPATPPPKPLPRDAPAADEVPAPQSPVVKQDTVASVASKKAKTDAKGVKVMPRQYETCDPKDLGVLIADMLMELIRLNDKIPLKDGKLTRFHSRAPPGISCHDYLNRLIQHATLSPPILLSMVYYIDRLCALYPAFTIGSLTVHRFLITAATVASKGLSDSFWTNPTYARIGGISTGELATLELDFLQRVHFRIVPKPETLVDYYVSLVQRSDNYRLEDDSSTPGSESDQLSDPMDEDPT
ncbi:cyclin-like protein 1 [Elsinoe australis]|uniref:Cyclin-like protein 1 n=1 Tax=Elsinoe australis TaxID=40998 RepID=A0A4U7BGR0_9PEZI|nr:cyclin-like protein 1 [Elsinoe australis]